MKRYNSFVTIIRNTAGFLVLSLFLCLSVQAQDQNNSASPGKWVPLSHSGSDQPLKHHENAYVKAGEKFYLIGGRGERPVEIYDPADNSWTKGATSPLSMHHFQAVSHEGKIYVSGAFNGGFPEETPIPNVYIYDPETDCWEKGPEIPADRRHGAAGAVSYDGKIYVVAVFRTGISTDTSAGWMLKFPYFLHYWHHKTKPDSHLSFSSPLVT